MVGLILGVTVVDLRCRGGGVGELVTPLFFDAGVALTVIGSVAAAIKGLEAA